MTDVVITAAKRTPVGSFLGSFAATPAHELGRVAIEAALALGTIRSVVETMLRKGAASAAGST